MLRYTLKKGNPPYHISGRTLKKLLPVDAPEEKGWLGKGWEGDLLLIVYPFILFAM